MSGIVTGNRKSELVSISRSSSGLVVVETFPEGLSEVQRAVHRCLESIVNDAVRSTRIVGTREDVVSIGASGAVGIVAIQVFETTSYALLTQIVSAVVCAVR